MKDFLSVLPLYIIAAALIALIVTLIALHRASQKKSASLEGKFYFDSGRIVWRVVNTGRRNLTVVEIGLMCGGKVSSYRPLYSQTEDINLIPCTLSRGEVASYRKEIERFAFRQSEIESLKIINPYIRFFCKDAEGQVYSVASDVRFNRYITELSRQ